MTDVEINEWMNVEEICAVARVVEATREWRSNAWMIATEEMDDGEIAINDGIIDDTSNVNSIAFLQLASCVLSRHFKFKC